MEKSDISKLKFNISEIFYSIQGEGTRAGMPCVFVRLMGCMLRCSWCDTAYALDLNKIEIEMTGQEILDKIKSYNCNFVEFTGGEPLAQSNTVPMMAALCDLGYDCAIETNGHADVSALDKRISKIMDVKCPGSKMSKFNNYDNINHLTKNDEVKFVIASREDFDWACGIVEKHGLPEICAAVIFSPVFQSCTPKELAEWVLASGMNVRMQIQMHKIIWPPDMRGV